MRIIMPFDHGASVHVSPNQCHDNNVQDCTRPVARPLRPGRSETRGKRFVFVYALSPLNVDHA